MTTGKSIRFIRTFRGMTQKELGIALGFDAGSADIRVSQYESDNRKTIKEPMLRQMAEILIVTYNALKSYEYDNPLDVMESFFWFEEEFPLQIALFEFQTDKDIDKPSMKIPAGTDGEAIESPIAVMFFIISSVAMSKPFIICTALVTAVCPYAFEAYAVILSIICFA